MMQQPALREAQHQQKDAASCCCWVSHKMQASLVQQLNECPADVADVQLTAPAAPDHILAAATWVLKNIFILAIVLHQCRRATSGLYLRQLRCCLVWRHAAAVCCVSSHHRHSQPPMLAAGLTPDFKDQYHALQQYLGMHAHA
jgi:hypothetical protein